MSQWIHPGPDFPVVGKFFTLSAFAKYVVEMKDKFHWSPHGVTIHHTGVPSLLQRPDGFMTQHMHNLRHFYKSRMHWSHGPHLFVDDVGIWVFNPLTLQGVHAKSFNSSFYGIEILGNYDIRAETTDRRGIAAIQNGQTAAAILLKYICTAPKKLNFHRDDPKTSKTCPGKYIDFNLFEAQTLLYYGQV